MKQVKPGKFFVIEGIDGSGKTTVFNRLKQFFPDFEFIREPGGTPLGERLRKVILSPDFADTAPETKLLLFFAARAELAKKIATWRKNGRHIISDRFDASTYAYQVPRSNPPAGGVDLGGLFRQLRRSIVEKPLVLPTAYFFLALPLTEAVRRLNKGRGVQDHFENVPLRTIARRQTQYDTFAASVLGKQDRWIEIDAAKSPEDVAEEVEEVIRRHIC